MQDNTALVYACQHELRSAMEFLFDNGADAIFKTEQVGLETPYFVRQQVLCDLQSY